MARGLSLASGLSPIWLSETRNAPLAVAFNRHALTDFRRRLQDLQESGAWGIRLLACASFSGGLADAVVMKSSNQKGSATSRDTIRK